MLVANRMTPPHYPARAVATVIPAAGHRGNSAPPPDASITYQPASQFRPGGEHKTNL